MQYKAVCHRLTLSEIKCRQSQIMQISTRRVKFPPPFNGTPVVAKKIWLHCTATKKSKTHSFYRSYRESYLSFKNYSEERVHKVKLCQKLHFVVHLQISRSIYVIASTSGLKYSRKSDVPTGAVPKFLFPCHSTLQPISHKFGHNYEAELTGLNL